MGTKKRKKASELHVSEIMAIQVLFHFSGYRNFKTFYRGYVCHHLRSFFPNTVSYNRIVEMKRDALIPLAIYLKTMATGACTSISFIDSTPLRVCHNIRIHNHKVFVQSAGFMVSNSILLPLKLEKSGQCR